MDKLLHTLQCTILILLFSSVQAQDWNQILKTTASDREDKQTAGRSSGDVFGMAVSISGDYAIIGAHAETDDEKGHNPMVRAGVAYIFKKTGDEWKMLKKLYPDVRQSDHYFGSTVDISGSNAIVGADANKSAYIFQKDNGGTDNWGLVKRLTPGDANEGGSFATTVTVSSNHVAVGAGTDDGTGSVYLYTDNFGGTGNWGLVKKIKAPSPQQYGRFGSSVSLCGDSLIVGSSDDNLDELQQNPITSAGAAYIFHKDRAGSDNWGFVKKLVAPTRIKSAGFGSSVDINGPFVIIGAPSDDPLMTYANAYGAAYIYENTAFGSDDWVFTKKLVAPVRGYFDYFGRSVSISGNFAVVGSAFDDEDQLENNPLENSGSAYIFGRNQDGFRNWGLIRKVTARYRNPSDNFGNSVAIGGDNILIGAPGEDEDEFEQNTLTTAGAAFFYSQNVGETNYWGKAQKVVASTGSLAKRHYGAGVSISGNYAIVGSGDQRNGNGYESKGPVYILYNNGGNWTEVKRIDPPEQMPYDNFGSSVAINGNYAVVGAADGNIKIVDGQIELAISGVYLFEKDRGGPGNWGLVKSLEPAPTRNRDDRYGLSVAVSGDYVVVGAPGYRANSTVPNDYTGAAFLFQKDHGGSDNWGLLKTITPLFLNNGDNFGWSVAIEGNSIWVGARFSNYDSGENYYLKSAGAAYLYEKELGGSNNWGLKQKITSPFRHEYQSFGSSVSMSGDNLIVGASGDQFDSDNGNAITYAGAAYVFSKNNQTSVWEFAKKITATFRSQFTYFGESVAISGENAIVGHAGDHYDISNSNYVNAAGSASVFKKEKNGVKWAFIQKLAASQRYSADQFGFRVSISGSYILVGAPGDSKDYNERNWLTRDGSVYIFRSNQVALPVTLSSFGATKVENYAALKWSTTGETNSDFFEIQKSSNGLSWQVLGNVNASRASNSFKSYSFDDYTPFHGENFYRLKMVDLDGSFAYSRIRSLSFDSRNAFTLYPNPTADRIYPNAGDLSKIESVTIINSLGQLVFESQSLTKDGISIRHLASGIYTIQIKKMGEAIQNHKVIVAR